jgi:hypothetical protein
MNNRLFHYTTVEKFKQILKDGKIKPATAFVDPGEKAATWFSFHSEFEPTARKMGIDNQGHAHIMNIDEMTKYAGGVIRIEVDEKTAPLDWKTFKDLSGIKYRVASFLYEKALQQGARVGQWRCTFSEVPEELWLAVEIMKNGVWEPLSEDDELPEPEIKVSDVTPVANEVTSVE